MKKNLQPILLGLIGLLAFYSCSSTKQMMNNIQDIAGHSRGMEIPESTEPYPEPTPRSLLLGKLTPPRTCYDVTFYDMNIDIDIDNRKIAGFVDFHSIAMDNFVKLQFDLAKNMIIDEVNFRGKSLPYTREEDAVFVTFPQINKSDSFQFRVIYHGEPMEATRPPRDLSLIHI